MTEHRTIRQVIRFVGLIALLCAVAVAVLAYQSKDVPEALLAIGTTSLGALTAMLVKTSGSDDGVQQVQVQQPPDEPVPVTGVDGD